MESKVTKIEYRVRTKRNFFNGKFHDQWRIEKRTHYRGILFRGGLVRTEPFADVNGKRSDAVKIARHMTSELAKK